MTGPILTPSQDLKKPARNCLSPAIQDILKERGFEELSTTQEAAIPPIVQGNHVLIIAPTGTGKTESAMLPVFDRLKKSSSDGFRALYITPLRSLNRDILSRMQWWCERLDLSIGVRHGDTTQYERRKQALSPPDLLVTTPETLQALFLGSRLRNHLKNIDYVIIDEIHELAGSKRGAQLSVALERLVEYAGEFQRIGLSATVGNPDEVMRFLVGNRGGSLVDIPVAPHIQMQVSYAGDEFPGQVKAVERCLASEPSTLLFVNTRVTAEALGHALYGRGDIDVHHGSLSRDVRIEAEERFKSGVLRALICTSSMELGLDIGHIDQVVQFGSPREVRRILQRVGRAGHRLDTVSRGTILTTGFDDLLESMVISRKAKANECENLLVPRGATDVLANQIAAIAAEYGEISFPKLNSIISRSYCFCDDDELIQRVADQLTVHRLVRIDQGMVCRTGRTRMYMNTNLSMIHDERSLLIIDITTRRAVGSLDQSFVVTWLHTGAAFIAKGQVWEVLSIEEGKILVEPARRLKGELPSWEGEQIPVPFAVAQEVGKIRRTREIQDYAHDGRCLKVIHEMFGAMDHGNHLLPTDQHLILEYFKEGVILNVCGGHQANEALARVISILLSARFGTSVGIEVGAYRILFRLPSDVRSADVLEVLETLDPDYIPGILQIALKRTSLFKWRLIQVARKFGAIDADADFEKISIHRMLNLFEGTVLQDEVYRELFSESMDVNAAQNIIRSIRSGETQISLGPLSPLGNAGLSSSHDLVAPPGVDQAVLRAIKNRLEQDHVLLFCMNCRKWKSKRTVARVDDEPICPLCGAKLIAALKPWEDDLIQATKKKNKSEEDRAVEIKLLRNANLVLSGGKKAVRALAARGVGPETASRILAKMAEGDEFYKEILKAERTYIKTHRFWQ